MCFEFGETAVCDEKYRLMDAALFRPLSMEHPNAWLGHVPFACWLVKLLDPHVFVELGTHSGNSYFSFCQAVKEGKLSTRCHAVDTWKGEEHAGLYGEEVFERVNARNREHYGNFSTLLRMTFNEALDAFSNASIDLLHIDGLHTYEAVRHDFETWLPKLVPGAVVLLHDTNARGHGFGVWKLWEELQCTYPNHLEFFHSHGLGVLQLDGAPETKKLRWLQPSSPEQKKLREYFAALGTRQLEHYDLHRTRNERLRLENALAEKTGRIEELDAALAEGNGQIAALKAALNRRDEQTTALESALGKGALRIAKLEAALTERDSQMASILASRAWKAADFLCRIKEKLR